MHREVLQVSIMVRSRSKEPGGKTSSLCMGRIRHGDDLPSSRTVTKATRSCMRAFAKHKEAVPLECLVSTVVPQNIRFTHKSKNCKRNKADVACGECTHKNALEGLIQYSTISTTMMVKSWAEAHGLTPSYWSSGGLSQITGYEVDRILLPMLQVMDIFGGTAKLLLR